MGNVLQTILRNVVRSIILSPVGLFRNADYRAWFVGDTTSMVAVSLRQFALPLLAYGLTGSTAVAGVLVTVQSVVITLGILPGGVLVDRYDRRTTIRVYALGSLVVWDVVAVLHFADLLTWQVFLGLIVAGAILTGLFSNATDAALRSIVGIEHYPQAVTMNQGRDGAIELGSGPIGGFLYAVAAWIPFAGAGLGHALTWLATFGIRADLKPPTRERKKAHRELGEAMRWAWERQRLRWILPLIAFINFAVQGVLLGLQFSLLDRGYDARAIGWMAAVIAGAVLLGSLLAGRIIKLVPTGWVAVASLGAMALALIPTALSDSYPVILTGLGVGFLLVPALNSSMLGYTFALTPVELQGRAMAIVQTCSRGLAAIAPALVGWLLHAWGHTAAIGLFVVVTLLCAVYGLASSALRTIPKPSEWKDAPL